ncbi:MAG: pyridoxamine 5'-phosphate oxidase family protein [Ilumatobacteraceae bacterium]|jgi:PPOX class probable F420-dependent enzyme|nr:pyridoxamine 5'-phosphate oxidase family protein [Ilumatobacteraceae bacterium]
MANKRGSIQMTTEEIDAFLTGRHVMNIATIGPSGHPHLVAMWFAMIDGKPAFWTFGKSQKINNLRRDAKITALVEDGEQYNELRGVELVGTGRIIEDYDEILNIGLVVAEKYNGEIAVSEAALPFVRKQAEKRLGVVIDVEKIVSWDHNKLGGGY